MDSLPPDPYKALGVSKDADLGTVRTAHRKLVLKCHPDKVQDPELKAVKQDEFQAVQQAYELLSDDKRRSAYDEKVKLFELRKEMSRGNPTPRSNPFEYEIRTAAPRTSSNTYTRPPPSVYAQPTARSYEDVSFEEPVRGVPRKSTSYESADRKRSSREDERDRERRRYEEDDRARQKMERKAEKAVHSDKKKSRDKERRRGTEEKTRTRVTSAYVEDDSEDDYRESPSRSFERKASKQRMEEEIRMREHVARAEQTARARRTSRERERERPTIKAAPLDPKWNEHMDFAGQYMQAAKRKVEAHPEHPGMRRAEAFTAASPKYNIRYASPTQQMSDDDTPRRSSASSARKETRRSSDTPSINKGSRRSPLHPQDPYIVEPPSPTLFGKKPSLQHHSSAPPTLPTYARKEPVRSQTQEYPRTDKVPPLPRAQTFTSTGERGDRGREKGSSRLRKELFDSDSDSDVRVYSSPRHSHSPPPRRVPEPTRYIIDNGRSVPIKPRNSDHRSELRSSDNDAFVRERSESPRGTTRHAERPSMPRQSSDRTRAVPTRSQSQAYYPPDPPHAEPIILTARPKMSPREGSHRSSRGQGSSSPYFGEVKYMMPQYGPENIIYTSHPPQSGGDPWRRGGESYHRDYSYPSTSRGGREQIYT